MKRPALSRFLIAVTLLGALLKNTDAALRDGAEFAGVQISQKFGRIGFDGDDEGVTHGDTLSF